MKTHDRRPSGDATKKTVAGGDSSEKKYRATTVNMSLGGLGAKVGAYMGIEIVLMRIMPRISTIQGKKKYGFSVEGFSPEDGEHVMVFFDTRLRDDGTGYIRNFGGGIAQELAQRATEEEFYLAVEDLNAENDTSYDYNYEDWEAFGGALKLKPRFVGKPVVLGKEFVKTKTGNNMNVFQLDYLNASDFPHLEEDIVRYQALEGVPYDPDESYYEDEEASASSDSEPVPVQEPVPEQKAKTRSAPAANKKPVTRNRFASDAEEVAAEFSEPQTMGTEILKTVRMPDSVSEFIKAGYERSMSTDQIVLELVEKGYKETDAVDYVNTWLDARAGKASTRKAAATSRRSGSKQVTEESDIIKVARECKEKGMDSPETFDVLNKKFPDVSREDKRAALKSAGLIRV